MALALTLSVCASAAIFRSALRQIDRAIWQFAIRREPPGRIKFSSGSNCSFMTSSCCSMTTTCFAEIISKPGMESSPPRSKILCCRDRINSAKMKNKTKRKQSNPYTVLDLPKGTTDQKLIKKHWKKMSIICHPDKIASMHPDLRNLAQELMKDVNQAYDSLKNN